MGCCRHSVEAGYSQSEERVQSTGEEQIQQGSWSKVTGGMVILVAKGGEERAAAAWLGEVGTAVVSPETERPVEERRAVTEPSGTAAEAAP